VNIILAVYRKFINSLYSHFYILSIIVPIWTICTLSIKSHYNYLNIFSILLPITTFYRLAIVSLYRHLYTKYIWITYNITYKGSLDFGIPSVSNYDMSRNNVVSMALFGIYFFSQLLLATLVQTICGDHSIKAII